ncbi:MAG: hypothetical protein ACE15C_09725 [Phycisphaerae bacterium]
MAQDKAFVVTAAVRNPRDFALFAAQAARLKRHARVAMMVSSLSRKTVEDIPPGGSPWHEYTACLSVLHKFFPHPKIAPFINPDHVRKNRALLKACVKVLDKYKLDAAFATHEPFYLPEAFFVKYPRLRGARIDHPRRSRKEEFAPCFDCAEGREMLTWMTRQLYKDAPRLTDISWFTNDAGAGICWNEYLYPGPNGPDHCRGLSTGQRVRNILDAFQDGCGKDKVVVLAHANFVRAEQESIWKSVDKETFLYLQHDNRLVSTGTVVDNPVKGIINPLAVIGAMEKWTDPSVRRAYLGFATNYSRSHDLPEVTSLVIDVIDAYLTARPPKGTLGRLNFLRKLCSRWAGERQADALFEALLAVDDAYKYKAMTIPRFSGNYIGVSMRMITRPLVIMPEKLTPDEEAYFLPHVFNPNINEGRMDYLDWHGGRLQAGAIDETDPWVRVHAVDTFVGKMKDAAGQLEKIDGKGEVAIFREMALSLRMYASIIRSIGNFYPMQVLRDRSKEKFATGPHIPPKVFSMTGDPDLLQMNELMRDELDNTSQLIDMLESGGLKRFVTASGPGDVEDTFMLGADIVNQLRKKMAIMRRHWCDAAAYLAMPHK